MGNLLFRVIISFAHKLPFSCVYFFDNILLQEVKIIEKAVNELRVDLKGNRSEAFKNFTEQDRVALS